MKFLLVFSCIFIKILKAEDDEPVQEQKSFETCVQNLKEKSSYLAGRFSYEQAEWMCKRRDDWAESRKDAGFKSQEILTPFQQQYLRGIRSCKGINECLPTLKEKRKKRELFRKRVVRKEYRTLSEEEKDNFHRSLNILKASTIDGVSKYNLLIRDHVPSNAPEAHFGCAFLPFHRELLKQLEVAMRLEIPDAFIPYWDSSLDQGLPDPCDSVLWTNEFAGSPRNAVEYGPYKTWKTTVSFGNKADHKLIRNCGGSKHGELFNPVDFEYYLSKSRFHEIFCNCNDATFELNHGLVHEFVGGHMIRVSVSPNDPLFFQHHTFVDYLWERFRQLKQNVTQREIDYPPDGELACSPDHYADSPMLPFFGLKNRDGLRNVYTDQFYTYALSPTCKRGCTDPYLFCDRKKNRCLAKIRIGGNCTGYSGREDVCEYGVCDNGICDLV